MLWDLASSKEKILADFSETETNGLDLFRGLTLMIPSPPPQIAYQEVLVVAEASAEYFS